MVTILQGDALEKLREMPPASINMCVTSPPYFGLRDYGHAGQIGLEATPAEYVAKMVEVFAEVRRVLREDGTLWLNLGDSYAGSWGAQSRVGNTPSAKSTLTTNGGRGPKLGDKYSALSANQIAAHPKTTRTGSLDKTPGLKAKDLIGIPWAVAKALQAPQYNGRIKSERDRVWLAAIIDGEGSICGYHHTRKDDGTIRTGIHVTITNTNFALLAEAQRIWPTSREDGNAHGPGALGLRECRRWIAHDVDEKAMLLREIYPYLIAKKKQALLAYNFLEMSRIAKRFGKLQEGIEMKGRRSRIVHLLSALNAGLPAEIPDWIVEPESCFSDGWYLRSDIIWSKLNPMPESVTDRCTKAHEYLFMLAKSERYYFDADAIAEPSSSGDTRRPYLRGQVDSRGNGHDRGGGSERIGADGSERNKRTVWTVATSPYSEAHFATFPPGLIRPCILAGCPTGGTVLDPFGGSGTTGEVAEQEGRHSVLIELNPQYVELAKRRTSQMGLLHSA